MDGVTINHIALTVSDWDRSHAFYSRVLGELGGSQTAGGVGAPHRNETGRWCLFSGGTGITLWEAAPDLASNPFQIYAPGLHHLAFSAPDRSAVDRMAGIAIELGAEILQMPDAQAKSYVLFFLDPDGMKIEYRAAA